MADPAATVEKIVKIGLKIKDAADTVRHNEQECHEIRRRVLRFSAILSQLQQTGMMDGSPAMSDALEDLEESLQHALELVTASQEKSTIRQLVSAGDLSKQLRRVKDDILNKVMMASFAINTHTSISIVLLTIQAGGQPPPRKPEDARVADISHNIHSAALKNFDLSELKAAINGGKMIGQGASCRVYKTLGWPSLLRIIEGVAEGIHYLHEQHVVHMDLKPGNIVLDSDMNPKIIDFELSKVLNDTEIVVDCVVGTYGFIAPEYVLDGIVSMKKDVYAFGLILLESISGICISKPRRHDHTIKWAWEAWESGRIEEYFDPSLFDGFQLMQIKRCVVLGLLCAQDDRADRPTMADVLEMLNGKEELPAPKKSAYFKSDEEGPA